MIARTVSDKLKELLAFFPAVGIIGPRQVGKTTIAKTLMSGLDKGAIYIDLENPRDLTKLNDPVLFFEENKGTCVVLDEVQRLPRLFPILRSMIDMKKVPARFILLGSASPELIRDSSESLAGRIAYEELTGFNLEEVGTEHQKALWYRGGFPDAFLASSEAQSVKWRQHFIQTYIEKDLPILGLDIDRMLIRKLWTMLAHLHGQTLNYSMLARSLELSSVSIGKYITFMQEALLVRMLPPFACNARKRLVKAPKIYLRDSGILHYLLNINTSKDILMHPVVGASWEGFVIEQVLQKLDDRMEAWHYRTHQGAECDLVLTKSAKPLVGIEIKYTSSPRLTKGNIQSFADLKTKYNYVITPDTDDYLISKDTRVCSLASFLGVHINKW